MKSESGKIKDFCIFYNPEGSGEGGGSLGRAAPLMRVFGEDGVEEESRDEIINEPSSIFNRLVIGEIFKQSSFMCSSSDVIFASSEFSFFMLWVGLQLTFVTCM